MRSGRFYGGVAPWQGKRKGVVKPACTLYIQSGMDRSAGEFFKKEEMQKHYMEEGTQNLVMSTRGERERKVGVKKIFSTHLT